MKLFDKCWATVLYLLDVVTLTSWSDRLGTQQPLHGSIGLTDYEDHYPIFHPPNGPEYFQCDYTAMGTDWVNCSTPTNRGCWLRNKVTGEQYDINTDYETKTPQGITRKYWLDVANKTLSGDGFMNVDGKVFNDSYPGPWIQACWGDTLEINVTNHLQYNGTTVHWHGIRQLHTLEMDGVNGVTQCPIAPGDSFTYKFKASQYGTSWYHSHYALQYADGLVGPLTLYGPSSANYTDHIEPILMADWNHRSAFANFDQEINPHSIPKGPPRMTSILLNGTGTNFNNPSSYAPLLTSSGPYACSANESAAGHCLDSSYLYNITFMKGNTYLLRLINTAVDTDFVFAIDEHNITVISSDFVPIKPYVTDSVLVAIGQRYHVVVEATGESDQAYWIRTIPATGCNGFNAASPPDSKTGILYYDECDETETPDTMQGSFPIQCSDEPYDKLIPVLPWTVGGPSNDQSSSTFEVGLDFLNDTVLPPSSPAGNYTRWELGSQPLYLNFSDPTILGIHSGTPWAPNHVVVPQLPLVKNDNTQWVYLLVTATAFPFQPSHRAFVPTAHPIHLHGHDFVILAQSNTTYWDGLAKIKTDNPPRRDVALLPSGGYLLIAFKADNPGSWLMHCHIAWHASSGLAVQILERESAINISKSSMNEVVRVCKNWDEWYSNPDNWWDSSSFQEDSGV